MPHRTASPAIGLIRALIASGTHTQAARSLTHPPSPTPTIPAPTPKPLRRHRPTHTSSSIGQPPPPSSPWPRLIP